MLSAVLKPHLGYQDWVPLANTSGVSSAGGMGIQEGKSVLGEGQGSIAS